MAASCNWQRISVGDVITFTRGLSWSKRDESADGVPVIAIPNVRQTGIDGDFKYRIRKKVTALKRAIAGDILLVGSSGGLSNVGRTAVVPELEEPIVGFASFLLKATPKPGTVDNEFVAHLLSREVVDYGQCVKRAADGRFNLQVETLKQYEMLLPPIPEQRAIARALRALQEAREARRREIELQEEHKAALMEYLFTHGTRNEPTKQTEIGEVPESWDVAQLSSLACIRYGLGQPPELDPEGVPMIRATDIKNGRISSDSVIRVSPASIPQTRNPYLNAGDILVVRSGAYTGDVALYDGRWDTTIAGYDLVVTPQVNKLLPMYAAQYLLSNAAQRYFISQRDRSAQPHLNSLQLGNTRIPLPSLGEQNAIANILASADCKAAASDRESELLDELFNALLEELMTGRLSAVPLIETEGQDD